MIRVKRPISKKHGYIKTQEQIQSMIEGGAILARILETLLNQAKEGVSEIELDELAERLILQSGCRVAFKEVDDYKNALCFSVNDVIVHGIPTGRRMKKGDIVGIDIGLIHNGMNVDMSHTISIGMPNDKVKKFLRVGEHALYRAIEQAKVGNRVGNISKTIQDIIEQENYSVVKNFVGHGIGKYLHEEPEVPGYLFSDMSISDTPELLEGMTIAIEVIYNMGSDEIKSGDDDWTYKTVDGSLSGLFERSVVITENGPKVLTK